MPERIYENSPNVRAALKELDDALVLARRAGAAGSRATAVAALRDKVTNAFFAALSLQEYHFCTALMPEGVDTVKGTLGRYIVLRDDCSPTSKEHQ